MAEIRDNYRYVAVGVITSNKLSVLTSNNGISFNVLYKDVFTPTKGNKSLSHPSIKVVGDYFYIVYFFNIRNGIVQSDRSKKEPGIT